jgi:hypothetical protein
MIDDGAIAGDKINLTILHGMFFVQQMKTFYEEHLYSSNMFYNNGIDRQWLQKICG